MNPIELDKLKNLLADMRAYMPTRIEYEVLRAKLAHERYRALLNAGFTDAQALELIKAWGEP